MKLGARELATETSKKPEKKMKEKEKLSGCES
jgi:hypothetical protein